MRNRIILGVGSVAVGLTASTTNADYVGLAAILESAGQMTAAGPRNVYRVYAEFTNPTDRVNAWYGLAGHPFTIQNVLADGVTLGSGFTNFGGSAGTLPPEVPGTVRDWDTWATIGITNGSEGPDGLDDAMLSPGFPVFISGNMLTASNASISIPLASLQGRADWRVVGNDTNLRVLLMQLVVNVGQHVRGTINVHGEVDVPIVGLVEFTALDQTFTSVPAPGVLAALSLASLCTGRRGRVS